MSMKSRLGKLWQLMEGIDAKRLPGCDVCRGRAYIRIEDSEAPWAEKNDVFNEQGKCHKCGLEACSTVTIKIVGFDRMEKQVCPA